MLSLWQYAFITLSVTSLSGMVLFFGYTFRLRMSYPLTVVSVHLVLSVVTTGLFLVAGLHALINKSLPRDYAIVLVATLSMILATLIVGLMFYFRFNLKKIDLNGHFVVVHLIMTSIAFILATSLTIAMTQSLTKNFPIHPSLYNFYKHHRELIH